MPVSELEKKAERINSATSVDHNTQGWEPSKNQKPKKLRPAMVKQFEGFGNSFEGQIYRGRFLDKNKFQHNFTADIAQ